MSFSVKLSLPDQQRTGVTSDRQSVYLKISATSCIDVPPVRCKMEYAGSSTDKKFYATAVALTDVVLAINLAHWATLFDKAKCSSHQRSFALACYVTSGETLHGFSQSFRTANWYSKIRIGAMDISYGRPGKQSIRLALGSSD